MSAAKREPTGGALPRRNIELSAPASTQALIEAFGVAAVAAISFGSTNLDNLVIVATYSAKSGYRAVYVRLTFVLVCLTVLLASLALAQVAAALPGDGIRYLGLIPIGIGSYHLARLVLRRLRGGSAPPDQLAAPVGVAGYAGFAAALLANSADSVIVMTPLLADLTPAFVVGCFVAAAATAVAMGMLASLVARHPAWSAYVEKISEWALPFILIGIGALILANGPSDVFVG